MLLEIEMAIFFVTPDLFIYPLLWGKTDVIVRDVVPSTGKGWQDKKALPNTKLHGQPEA